jgi:hypothetical protein
MELEGIIQRFIDGEDLSVGELKVLKLSLSAGKEERVHFRVSNAEKMFLMRKAKQAGLSLSEYLRILTIKQMINPLPNETGDDPENN